MWGGAYEVFEFLDGQASLWYADAVPEDVCESGELPISEEAALRAVSWWLDFIDGSYRGNQVFVPDRSGKKWVPVWTAARACYAALIHAGLSLNASFDDVSVSALYEELTDTGRGR